MAKHSNTVYFSLDKESRDKLESFAHENESIGLVAKRLILEMIGGDRQSSPTLPPDLGDRLTAIEDQLERLENRAVLEVEDLERLAVIISRDYLPSVPGGFVHRLSTIERLLKDKDGLINQVGQILPYVDNRLEKIEQHLDWAKREILDQRQKIKGLESDAYWYQGDKPTETAIMIQKQPLPPTDLPSTPAEITLTHEEAAHEFERAARTVKSWANDPNKWPQGWIWDGDRQFWIKGV